ncbi:MAG: hypothetical protein ABEK01_02435 [Candidatus Nanohaloarchaea archaeon]
MRRELRALGLLTSVILLSVTASGYTVQETGNGFQVTGLSLDADTGVSIDLEEIDSPVRKLVINSTQAIFDENLTVKTSEDITESDFPDLPARRKPLRSINVTGFYAQVQIRVEKKNSSSGVYVKRFYWREKNFTGKKYTVRSSTPFILVETRQKSCKSPAYALTPDGQTCVRYRNTCQIPEGHIELRSCSVQDEWNRASKFLGNFSKKMTPRRAELLDRARDAFRSGNYTKTIDLVMKARRAPPFSITSIFAVLAGVLVLVLGTGTIYLWMTRDTEPATGEAAEITEELRSLLEEASQEKREEVGDEVRDLRSALEEGEIEEAEELLQEIREKL